MITLGIDPGFARLGYALVENKNFIYNLLDSGLIETFSKDSYNKRLLHIYNSLNEIIIKYKPNNAAIEELFFSKNTKTALKVAESRGIVVLALTINNVDFVEYKPKEIKSHITGNGNASKDAIMKMVNLLTNSNVFQDDTADAIAIALAHSLRNRF